MLMSLVLTAASVQLYVTSVLIVQ